MAGVQGGLRSGAAVGYVVALEDSSQLAAWLAGTQQGSQCMGRSCLPVRCSSFLSAPNKPAASSSHVGAAGPSQPHQQGGRCASCCSRASQGALAAAPGMVLPWEARRAAARPLGATVPAAAHLPPPALLRCCAQLPASTAPPCSPYRLQRAATCRGRRGRGLGRPRTRCPRAKRWMRPPSAWGGSCHAHAPMRAGCCATAHGMERTRLPAPAVHCCNRPLPHNVLPATLQAALPAGARCA